MRTLFIKLLIIILPVGGMVCITNYSVDPANLFSPPAYIEGIADILSNGDNVDNLSNYNERRLQEQMIKKLRVTPDIIVLGSSRVMEIGANFFPDHSVLNCGVSHANINDIYGIVGMLDSLHRLPHELLIGVDHFLLGGKGTSEWESLSCYRSYLLTRMGETDKKILREGGANVWDKAYSLFSFEYFKSSLNFLMRGNSKRYRDVGKRDPSVYGRFSDGTISYSNDYKDADTAQTAINARNTGRREGIPGTDPAKVLLFNKLLDYLQSRGVRVTFILIPYHQELYNAVNNYHDGLLRSYESLYRKMAGARNIRVLGGFDARRLQVPDSRFYDMYHCSKEGIKAMLDSQKELHVYE